jgi:hypothetical protein
MIAAIVGSVLILYSVSKMFADKSFTVVNVMLCAAGIWLCTAF